MRTWPRRLLIALLLAVGALFAGAASASADCAPSGVPNYAGSGIPGLIDNPVQNPGGTLYGQYGWGGYRWYTCDLGIGPEVANDPAAVGDTWLGNIELGAATTLGASMTQLHQWVADPGTIMAPIDSAVADIAGVIRGAIWNEYAPALIILAGAMVIVRAMNGDTRRTLHTVAAIGAAALVIAWVFTPRGGQPGAVAAAQQFDGVVNAVVGGVDRSLVSSTGAAIPAANSDDEARGATLADKVIYPLWARGALGTEDQRGLDLARRLYRDAATVSYANAGSADAEEYRGRYNDIAEEINNANPGWYTTLRGQSYNRTGQGFLAMVLMLIIAAIRIPAELLVLIGLLVMRLAVMFAPIFALAGILESTRPYAKAALKMTIASVVNVAIFGIVASVHTGIVGITVARSTNIVQTLFVVLGVTVIVWMLSKPFRSPTRLATGQAAADALEGAASAPSNALNSIKGMVGAAVPSMIGSYIGSRRGAEEGVEEGQERDRERRRGPDTGPRPEQWSRLYDGDGDPSDLPECRAEPYRSPEPAVVPVRYEPIESTPQRLALPPGPGPEAGASRPVDPLGPGPHDGSAYATPEDAPEPGREVIVAQRVRYDEDEIFVPDLVVQADYEDPDWHEPIRVNGKVRLIEPEYDKDGNLTYDIYMPEPEPEGASR